MRKFILTGLLALMTTPVFASGLFYNAEKDGEGILLLQNADTSVVYFFTYAPNQGCWDVNIPPGTRVTKENCHEQRWFFAADDIGKNGRVTGFLYAAAGMDYPFGVPDPQDPFASIVGEAQLVGLYIMEPSKTGWRMIVTQIGSFLQKDDPLFDTVYEFQTQLFKAE